MILSKKKKEKKRSIKKINIFDFNLEKLMCKIEVKRKMGIEIKM